MPGIPVEVVDVTGAGDTFGSSFLHAVMHSDDMKLCAEFANFAAARAVTGLGARYGAASAAELRRFIKMHSGEAERYEVFLR